jgi:hypothetical protein
LDHVVVFIQLAQCFSLGALEVLVVWWHHPSAQETEPKPDKDDKV